MTLRLMHACREQTRLWMKDVERLYGSGRNASVFIDLQTAGAMIGNTKVLPAGAPFRPTLTLLNWEHGNSSSPKSGQHSYPQSRLRRVSTTAIHFARYISSASSTLQHP